MTQSQVMTGSDSRPVPSHQAPKFRLDQRRQIANLGGFAQQTLDRTAQSASQFVTIERAHQRGFERRLQILRQLVRASVVAVRQPAAETRERDRLVAELADRLAVESH
jgi:hypothetical protein